MELNVKGKCLMLSEESLYEIKNPKILKMILVWKSVTDISPDRLNKYIRVFGVGVRPS